MSYTALYRKFRPSTFEDVKGQDHIVTTLKNQIRADRIGHAEVKSAIETQIRMVFFLPIVVAALHVVAAFPLIRRVLSLLIMDSGQLFVWCLVTTVLAFAVIYYVVFRITSKIYYRIVGNQVR